MEAKTDLTIGLLRILGFVFEKRDETKFNDNPIYRELPGEIKVISKCHATRTISVESLIIQFYQLYQKAVAKLITNIFFKFIRRCTQIVKCRKFETFTEK